MLARGRSHEFGANRVLYRLAQNPIDLSIVVTRQLPTERLLNALKRLRDLGNTLVLVEHDREVIEAADHLVDFGPGSGDFGGEVTAEGTPQYWAEQALALLRPPFDPQKPTALFIGRYQPFHAGHQRLIEEGLRRVGQVCIAVRNTHGIDAKNPLPFFAVKQRIETALSAYSGRFVVVPLPNITNVFYGRDVGYNVERIVLDEETEAISATKIRGLSAAPGSR